MPETKKPDMKQPKADKQEAEKAQMPRTEGMKPESKVSMMPKAEAPKATLPNTGEASSAIGWLGGALATLATGLYLFKTKRRIVREFVEMLVLGLTVDILKELVFKIVGSIKKKK